MRRGAVSDPRRLKSGVCVGVSSGVDLPVLKMLTLGNGSFDCCSKVILEGGCWVSVL